MDTNITALEEQLSGSRKSEKQVALLNQLTTELRFNVPLRALASANEAVEAARAFTDDNPLLLITSLLNLTVLRIDTDAYEAALTSGLEALQLAAVYDLQQERLTILRILGNLYSCLEIVPRATNTQNMVLRLAEEANDRQNLTAVLINIGQRKIRHEQAADAFPYLKRALELAQADEFEQELLDAHSAMSKAHLMLGDFEQALVHGKQSLELVHSTQNTLAVIDALLHIACIYYADDQFEQAIPVLDEALQLTQTGSYPRQHALVKRILGQIASKQWQFEPAQTLLFDALKLAEQDQSKVEVYNIHQALVDVYKLSENYEKALEHAALLQQVQNEIHTDQATVRGRALEKLLEFETIQYQADLAKLRDKDLHEEIAESQQVIAELNRFAGTVAHDLKSPLAIVLGYSGLALEDLKDIVSPEVLQIINTMHQMSHKMNRIIDELLVLSSVRREDVKLRPVQMNYIVEDSLARLQILLQETNAEIIVPTEWPTALGYEIWIEEVWANYISNAIKYGGQPARIELGADAPHNNTVRFWVHDNGEGLTADQQAQMFVEYTRLDEVRAKGHGLGLSIVKRIVEKLGGEVGVESKPGEGSIFWFTLQAASD